MSSTTLAAETYEMEQELTTIIEDNYPTFMKVADIVRLMESYTEDYIESVRAGFDAELSESESEIEDYREQVGGLRKDIRALNKQIQDLKSERVENLRKELTQLEADVGQ